MYRYLTLCCLLVVACTFAHAELVFGVVTGPDGKPVSGARVIVYEFRQNRTLASVKTDPDGKYRAEAQTNPQYPYKPSIVVYAPGYVYHYEALKAGEYNVQLQQAVLFKGRVVDTKHKPVADAKLRLWYAETARGGEVIPWWIPDELTATFKAKTGADGVYTLPGLPEDGVASIVLEDPRFVGLRARFQLGNPAAEAATLVARPGATIEGKAVFENGKPAVGIYIYAEKTSFLDDGDYASDITAADGSFRLTGLSTGTVRVTMREPPEKIPWTAEAIAGVMATEGRVTRVKNMVLISGGFIEGVVTDAGTGQPIPNLYLHASHFQQNDYIANASTDQTGHYTMRIPPGKYSVGFDPYLNGYVIPGDGLYVEVTVNGTETQNVPFKLSKGLSVSGIVVDEAGRPVAGVMLEVNIVKTVNGYDNIMRANGKYGETGADGKFSISGFSTDKVQLAIRYRNAKPSETDNPNAWEIVKSPAVQLPAAQPVSITVRKVIYQTLTTHTVTPDGKPIPQVKVEVLSQALLTEPKTGYSDANGCLTLPYLRSDATISLTSAEKSGYKKVSGGTITKHGGTFHMDDIVLAPMTGKISGQVVDAQNGKPLAGAKVTTVGQLTSVMTDARGHFSLDNLPQGEVIVMAAHNYAGSVQPGLTGDTPLTITLTEPARPKSRDTEQGLALIERIWKESEKTGYCCRDYLLLLMQRFDANRAQKMAAGFDPLSGDFFSLVIDDVVKHDAAHIADWVPKIEQLKTPSKKSYALYAFALAVVDTNPTLATELYHRLKAVKIDDWWGQFSLDRDVLKLAIRLKNGEEDTLFATVMEKMRKPQQDFRLSQQRKYIPGELMEYSPTMARKLADALPGQWQADAYAGMVRAIVKKDLKLARTLLDERGRMPDDSAFGYAAEPVIAAIGKDDPDGALKLARKATGYYRQEALMAAAQFFPRAKKLELLREASVGATAREKVRLAAQVYAFDHTAGLKMFAEARKALTPTETEKMQMRNDPYNQYIEIGHYADFASAFSVVDPAESRLLLEQEYAKYFPTLTKENSGGMESLVMAMTPLDLERAQVITATFPDSDSRFECLRAIAQYLLATDEVRRRSQVDRGWNGFDPDAFTQ